MKSSTMKAILKALHILLLVTVSVAGQAAVESNTYILTDHLGSPILATDENGETLWREGYQPYGIQLTNEDGDNSVGFTGHKNDKALGVTYMQGRWYHQEMGRFLAIDPVGFEEGNPITFNRYAYANNNPYKYVDPDGRSSAIPTLVILGIVITVAVSPEILITTSPGNSSQVSSQTEGFLYHPGTNDDSGGYEMPDFELPIWVTKEGDDVIELPHTDKDGNIISRNPRSLQDEMTLDAAKQGEGFIKMENLGDTKYKGWDKMELNTTSSTGGETRVHYNKNPETGETDDFKFKKHSTDKPYHNK